MIEQKKPEIRILAAGKKSEIEELHQRVFASCYGFASEITPLGAAAVEAAQQGIDRRRPFAVIVIHLSEQMQATAIETIARIRRLDQCVNFVILGESPEAFEKISPDVLPANKMLFRRKPFHREEILQSIMIMGSMWLSEKSLQEASRQLLDLNTQFIETSDALSGLARHLESRRRDFENSVIERVRTLIIPIVQKLQQKRELKRFRPELELLIGYVENLTADMANDLRLASGLSRTEVQIASFIKNGMTSDEIASYMNISVFTVKTHRKNIRRKLAIRNSGVNLRSYLAGVAANSD